MMLMRESEETWRSFRDVVNDAIRRGMVDSVAPRAVVEVPVLDLGRVPDARENRGTVYSQDSDHSHDTDFAAFNGVRWVNPLAEVL
jgi:hypothetical protein